jgi:putative ABC transport system ATP-binding protein
MITLHQVSKTFFRGTPSEVKAVQPITLHIASGEMVILAGSNGSGKSTLLNILSGTVIPDSGKIIFGNQNITFWPEHQRAAFISRLFQNPLAGTAPQLTVAENFRLAALRSQKKKLSIGLTSKFKESIAGNIASLQLGLETKLDTAIGRLSGGQRQALTLLMASMSGAKLILMDEPAAALDPKTGALVMQLADKIIREHHLTAILVTHHLRDMLHYGNRLLYMSEGKLLRDVAGHEKQQLTIKEVISWFDE